jgi:hypothetical protein
MQPPITTIYNRGQQLRPASQSSTSRTRCGSAFLLANGLHPENIRNFPSEARRDVRLTSNWESLSRDLSRFAEWLAILPSSSAILGTIIPGACLDPLTPSSAAHGETTFHPGVFPSPSFTLCATEKIGPHGRHLSISVRDGADGTYVRLCLRPEASVSDFVEMVRCHQKLGETIDFDSRQSHWIVPTCRTEELAPEQNPFSFDRSYMDESPADKKVLLPVASCFRFWQEAGVRLRCSLRQRQTFLSFALGPIEMMEDAGWLYITDHRSGLHLRLGDCQRPLLVDGSMVTGHFVIPLAQPNSMLRIQAEGLA